MENKPVVKVVQETIRSQLDQKATAMGVAFAKALVKSGHPVLP